MARTINLITIHCSATPSGRSISRPGMNAAQVIDAWHKERGFNRRPEFVAGAGFKGLRHIGYHFVIDVTGEVIEGRWLEEVGAHAAGYNAQSIGICMIGGAEREGRYTPAQWKALKTLVLQLMMKFGIPLHPPKRTPAPKHSDQPDTISGGVCGHRDLSVDLNNDGVITPGEWQKTCPGFDVAAWLQAELSPLPQHVFQEQVQ